MKALFFISGAAMEKSYMSMFLLLVAISCVLAKDIGKKETKETSTKPKLPQTLSRGKKHIDATDRTCTYVSFSYPLLSPGRLGGPAHLDADV